MDGIGGGPLVPQYLMSCYLYYEKNLNVITDDEFDEVCQRILKHWDKLKHPHKEYIKKLDLFAGTGFSLEWEKMPQIIKDAAMVWYQSEKGEIPS